MTLTPIQDHATSSLALYLQDYLNNASRDYYSSEGLPTQIAVEGVRDFKTDLNSVQRFPLLMVYRTGSRGDRLQFSDARIEYFVLMPVEVERQPGIFNFVEKWIAKALEEYDDTGDRCLSVPGQELRSEWIPLGRDGRSMFMLLRVNFSFEDYELP